MNTGYTDTELALAGATTSLACLQALVASDIPQTFHQDITDAALSTRREVPVQNRSSGVVGENRSRDLRLCG